MKTMLHKYFYNIFTGEIPARTGLLAYRIKTTSLKPEQEECKH